MNILPIIASETDPKYIPFHVSCIGSISIKRPFGVAEKVDDRYIDGEFMSSMMGGRPSRFKTLDASQKRCFEMNPKPSPIKNIPKNSKPTQSMKATNIVSAIEKITPTIAESYLATNAGNQRNVTNSHMWHLRQQMENGQWMMTGEPIVFDNEGRLIDGQHRLRAMIMAKVTLEFLVVRGVSPNSFVAMNRGKTRSNGNIFAIHQVPNYNAAASAVGGVLNYRRARAVEIKDKGKVIGYGGSLNSYVRASTTDLIQEYDAHPVEYGQAIAIAISCRKLAPQSTVATVAAISLIDAKHGIDEVLCFWDGFRTGANLESDDPILYLKTKMIENANSKRGKMTGVMTIHLMIETWNRYVKGKSCKFIRLSMDSGCPELI